MSTMVSQITTIWIVYSAVCLGADQRKHQSLASLAFVKAIYRWPVNSTHKRPVTWIMFPFDDVIMTHLIYSCNLRLMPCWVHFLHDWSSPNTVCNGEFTKGCTHRGWELTGITGNTCSPHERMYIDMLWFCTYICYQFECGIVAGISNIMLTCNLICD